MALIGGIEPFNKDSDITSYLERLEQLFICNVVEEGMKVPMLLTLIGSETYTVLKDLLAPDTPSTQSFEVLSEVLIRHFSPRRLLVAERYKFYMANQEAEEDVKAFAVRLRNFAKYCQFGQFLQDALRDKFVCGLRSEGIKRKLLSEDNISFDRALQIAGSMELTEGQLKVMATESELASVNKLSKHGATQQSKFKTHRHSSWAHNKDKSQHFNQPFRSNNLQCKRCPRYHADLSKCPAIHWNCYACGEKGHTSNSSMCKHTLHLVTEEESTQQNFKESGVQDKNGDSEDEYLQLGMLETESSNMVSLINCLHSNNSLCIELCIEGVKRKMEVDSGACKSVIHKDDYISWFPEISMTKVNFKLRVVTGQNVKILGQIFVNVKFKEETINAPLIVLDSDVKFIPLLGRDWLSILNPKWKSDILQSSINWLNGKPNDNSLVPVNQCKNVQNQSSDLENEIKEKFAIVFQSEGSTHILKFKVDFKLKDNFTPVFHRAYQMPYALKPKVEEEISRLVKTGVLKKVSHSSWASPIVVVPKKNSEDIRICVDFKKTLNLAIDTDHCTLPLPDDIYAQLSGSKVFTEIDLKNAFQQLQISPECQELLTINTHLGLFQYTKLPFGVSAAPGKFQSVMEAILGGLENVKVYLDNIFIWSYSVHDCHKKVTAVMKRLVEYNVKVNFAKCKFYKTSMEFLGHIIDANGIYPTKEKTECIRNAVTPTNLTQLKSYLGLLNYYRKFIPNLSEELKCLYDLCKNEVSFNWTQEHEQCFQKSKQFLMSNKVLHHFNPNLPIFITCDASGYGVGAVLSHGKDKPVLFVSSTLSSTEKKYSNLERESLAIIFALKKFHKYIFGRKFVLITDHEPLKFIFGRNKGIPATAAARITRWAILLSAYDYEIEYKKGKSITNADGLSRVPMNTDTEVSCELFSFNLSNTIPLNAFDIAGSTKKDRILQKVIEFTLSGWPHTVEDTLKCYFHKRHELSVEFDCLMLGNKVVIPHLLRTEVLSLFHEEHMGIVRTKMLIRSYCWWPGINSDIEKYISECEICMKFQNFSHKIYFPWPTASNSFFRVHLDFFYKFNFIFLIIVDQRSKYLDVKLMDNSSNARETIMKCKEFFSYFGLPTELVTDNGPPFNSAEFVTFCQANGIKPLKSPPYHPQSNGSAERYVQTVKKSLDKSIFIEKNQVIGKHLVLTRLLNFLFTFRNTPSTSTNQSPNSIIFKFRPRTRFDLIKPSYGNTRKNYPAQFESIIRNVKLYSVGDRVYVKDAHSNTWIQGKIVKVLSYCTYLVSVNTLIKFMHASDIRSNRCSVTEMDGSTGSSFPVVNEKPTMDDKFVVPENSARLENSNLCTSPEVRRDVSGTFAAVNTRNKNSTGERDFNESVIQSDNTSPRTLPMLVREQNVSKQMISTRSGRVVKPPVRLDL